ncbi:hypothetical protein DERP_006247 [Dermatophagoides pteronyssinus]|uniref:Uncharacterized protein n=1 Tax=Dermatophagoides pteronyssinus TaxID=6956 RepID=A0ABQ8IXY5_DERPT|nr:hypothetical protein DERP_006247 [Dermatophagoides pteronyssinus]
MKSSLWPSVLVIIIVVSSSSSVKSSIVNTGSSAVARSEDGHGNYIFGYDENHSTGGSFRKEKGGPGIQIGSYGLRDSDGRMRIVNYVADVNGFRASVETNEPGTINGHPDVGNKAGKITRHDNGGGTFSYSTSTEHIAPVLPQVYHHNGGGDSHISYPNYGGGGGANYAFSKANLQVPKQNDYYSALQSFYNNYHQHLSGGYLPKPKPMSYSSSTTHIAPMVPFLPKSYPQQSPSISQPDFRALLPQSPIPALRPAQQILVKNQQQSLAEKFTKNDPILNGYLAQQPNLQQQLSGNVQPIVVKKQQQQQPESPISTAQATILTSDGLSIPLSLSIHGLHKSY